MDQDNPAVLAKTAIPPALLEEFAKDPEAIRGTARVMLAVQLDRLHKHKDMSVPQRMEFVNILSKIGGAEPKATTPQGAGGGFSVQIILGNNPTQKVTTIDVDTSVVEVAPNVSVSPKISTDAPSTEE